jgi:hypothetical protein
MPATSAGMTIHGPASAVASRQRDSYSPPGSERGAARLAHLSGGQGVASSNLAAPTSSPPPPQSERLKETAQKLGAEAGEVFDVAVEKILKQTAAHIRKSAKK